jgi:hypothetical protein
MRVRGEFTGTGDIVASIPIELQRLAFEPSHAPLTLPEAGQRTGQLAVLADDTFAVASDIGVVAHFPRGPLSHVWQFAADPARSRPLPGRSGTRAPLGIDTSSSRRLDSRSFQAWSVRQPARSSMTLALASGSARATVGCLVSEPAGGHHRSHRSCARRRPQHPSWRPAIGGQSFPLRALPGGPADQCPRSVVDHQPL